jgi:hypothetical protein
MEKGKRKKKTKQKRWKELHSGSTRTLMLNFFCFSCLVSAVKQLIKSLVAFSLREWGEKKLQQKKRKENTTGTVR